MKFDIDNFFMLWFCIVCMSYVPGMFQFTYSLTEDDVKEDAILPLKFVKFQIVHSITVSTHG